MNGILVSCLPLFHHGTRLGLFLPEASVFPSGNKIGLDLSHDSQSSWFDSALTVSEPYLTAMAVRILHIDGYARTKSQ